MQRNAPPVPPPTMADRDSDHELATAITSQEELIAQAAANGQPIPPRFQASAGRTPPPVPSYGPPPSRTPPPAPSGVVSSAPPSSVPHAQSWAPPPQATPAP